MRTRASHSRTSSAVVAFASDIIGTECATGGNPAVARFAPARCVGESGVTRSGNSASIAVSSSKSASHCSSLMTGLSER